MLFGREQRQARGWKNLIARRMAGGKVVRLRNTRAHRFINFHGGILIRDIGPVIGPLLLVIGPFLLIVEVGGRESGGRLKVHIVEAALSIGIGIHMVTRSFRMRASFLLAFAFLNRATEPGRSKSSGLFKGRILGTTLPPGIGIHGVTGGLWMRTFFVSAFADAAILVVLFGAATNAAHGFEGVNDGMAPKCDDGLAIVVGVAVTTAPTLLRIAVVVAELGALGVAATRARSFLATLLAGEPFVLQPERLRLDRLDVPHVVLEHHVGVLRAHSVASGAHCKGHKRVLAPGVPSHHAL
jgi:hypothetical protein